jgi:cytochrome c peroxidase
VRGEALTAGDDADRQPEKRTLHEVGEEVRASTGTLTDEGRAEVSYVAADRGAFKAPTLREVARTAPYMHDGSFATLAAVIDFYDRGNVPNFGLDSQLRPLHLTLEEKRDLLAFQGSLNGKIRDGE